MKYMESAHTFVYVYIQVNHRNTSCGNTAPFGSSCRVGVPEGGGEGRSGLYHKCQLHNIQSPIGRKHQSNCNKHFTTNKNMLQEGTINWPQEKKIKTITVLLIIIVETK